MCLQSDASSRSDNIDSMEAIRSQDCSDNKHILKDCRVVVVPLVQDIARRKTVKVFSVGNYVFASRESSNCDLVVVDTSVEKNGCKVDASPISLYSTVDRGVITEVKCEDFLKRKCDFGADTEAEEEAISDIVKSLIERIASEPVQSQIDFESPGIKEFRLVEDFCRENGYESRDYRDLQSLFNFRTLPNLEITKTVKTANKRCKTQKKKTLIDRDEATNVKSRTDEGSQSAPSNNLSGLGLEKIENLKIRKILEDFGRLSKRGENFHAPKHKKMKTDSSCSKNSSFNKPLNLCKKDNCEMEKPVKISKSVQSDISISGSILRTLLHNQENGEDGVKERPENASHENKSTENNGEKTSKTSTAQQTDEEEKTVEKTQSQKSGKNDKWLNDPTAILKKIHKLKKDILYLDLLAEEKEKERIAILCFKNYKESILKKIFTNEMSEDVSEVARSRNHVIDIPSTSIPKLIHPSSNPPAEQRPSVLFPSNNSAIEGQNSYSALRDNPQVPVGQINDNFARLGNCVKCDFVKSNFLNSGYRNPWYCNPLCQTHSCTRHDKECRTYIVDSSTK